MTIHKEELKTIDRKSYKTNQEWHNSITVQFSCELLKGMIGRTFKIINIENLDTLDEPITIEFEALDG